jgi:hypothetical protein
VGTGPVSRTAKPSATPTAPAAVAAAHPPQAAASGTAKSPAAGGTGPARSSAAAAHGHAPAGATVATLPAAPPPRYLAQLLPSTGHMLLVSTVSRNQYVAWGADLTPDAAAAAAKAGGRADGAGTGSAAGESKQLRLFAQPCALPATPGPTPHLLPPEGGWLEAQAGVSADEDPFRLLYRRVRIFWPGDMAWFAGRVLRFK